MADAEFQARNQETSVRGIRNAGSDITALGRRTRTVLHVGPRIAVGPSELKTRNLDAEKSATRVTTESACNSGLTKSVSSDPCDEPTLVSAPPAALLQMLRDSARLADNAGAASLRTAGRCKALASVGEWLSRFTIGGAR